MNCCPNCFKDELLASEVESLSASSGDCDFCGRENVPICPLSADSPLVEKFQGLFDVFVPRGKTPRARIVESRGSLIEAFNSIWDIFAFSDTSRQVELLNQLFGEEDWYKALCDTAVDVTPRAGQEDLSKLRLFGDEGWSSFSNRIKHESRYFTRLGRERERAFLDFLGSVAWAEWPKDRPLYRARLWTKVDDAGKEVPPAKEDLHEAPIDCVSSGRMNAEGVPCLYVADSSVTAVAEIRAGMHDRVAVATLRPKGSFKYVDLGKLRNISPFDAVDCSSLLVNRDQIKDLANGLAAPVRTSDSRLDYVPTQYLSELIQRNGYMGIGYPSVMTKDGYNIALFKKLVDVFEIEKIDIVCVSGLEYELC